MHDLIRFFFSTAPHEFLAHFVVAGPMAAVSFSMGLNLKRIWLTTAALVALWFVCIHAVPEQHRVGGDLYPRILCAWVAGTRRPSLRIASNAGFSTGRGATER